MPTNPYESPSDCKEVKKKRHPLLRLGLVVITCALGLAVLILGAKCVQMSISLFGPEVPSKTSEEIVREVLREMDVEKPISHNQKKDR